LAIGTGDLRAVANVPLAILLNDRNELVPHRYPSTMAPYGKAIPQSIIGRDASRTGNGKWQGAAPLPAASALARSPRSTQRSG
jgi:hypothetical protein